MWFLFSIVFQLSKQVSFVLKQQMFCVYYFLLKGKKLLETNFFFNKMFTTRQWNTGEQQRVEKFPYFFFHRDTDNSFTDEFTKASNKNDKQRNNMTSEYEILMIYVNESIIYYLFA